MKYLYYRTPSQINFASCPDDRYLYYKKITEARGFKVVPESEDLGQQLKEIRAGKINEK